MPSDSAPAVGLDPDAIPQTAPQKPLTQNIAIDLAHSLSYELRDFCTRCRHMLHSDVELNNPDTVENSTDLIDERAISHTLAEIGIGTLMQIFSLLQFVADRKSIKSAKPN